MKIKLLLFILIAMLFIAGCSSSRLSVGPQQGEKWRAIHLLNYNSDRDLVELEQLVPKLDSLGINVIILEVDYHFEFESHPELQQGDSLITKKGAREFAKLCRNNHIRLIPEFQSVGHQSWAEETFPLLTKYPELDLTPGAFPNNKDIYCREWM